VQVATSVISELSRLSESCNLSVLVSTEVDRNLHSIAFSKESFFAYAVEDHHGASQLLRKKYYSGDNIDAIFVIFGPIYDVAKKIPVVMGFAQPWIAYPNNEVYKRIHVLRRWGMKIKFRIQAELFKRADLLIVELAHVQQQLINQKIHSHRSIRVISNCLSEIYQNPESWEQGPVLKKSNKLRIGFLGRNYIHKNTAILPDVASALKSVYGVESEFFVTFSESEWAESPHGFRTVINNVGPLKVSQCPSFYQQLDAVIFPSLLECFSATPLEAMAMHRPLFASDRQFNRDVCGEHAMYFDPLDPLSAARTIANHFSCHENCARDLNAARDYALNLLSPFARASAYLGCLREISTK